MAGAAAPRTPCNTLQPPDNTPWHVTLRAARPVEATVARIAFGDQDFHRGSILEVGLCYVADIVRVNTNSVPLRVEGAGRITRVPTL
jgi:hypothetical protein